MSEMLGVTDLNVPNGAEYVGSLDPVLATGPDFREPEPLGYKGLPLRVFRKELNDGSTRYDVISDYEPINGDQFLVLLDSVAPVSRTYAVNDANYDFYIRGVIADWDILDRRPETKGYVDYLIELHKNLGGPWQEFVQSQPTLLGLLYDVERPQTRSEFVQLGTEFAAVHHELSKELVSLAIDSPRRVTEICLEQEIEVDVELLILTAVAKQISRGSGKSNHRVPTNQNRPELWRRFQSMSKEKKEKMVTGLLRNSATIRKSGIFGDTFSGTHPGIKAVHAKYDTLHALFDTIEFERNMYAYPRRQMEEGMTLERAYEDRHEHDMGGYSVEVMNITDPKTGNIVKVQVPGGYRRNAPYKRVVPHIAWSRDNEGNGQFIIERSTQDEENLVAIDGLAGVILAAYLSPEARKHWPDRMSIKGSSQIMQAAQVPVLALIRSRDLLTGTLVQQVEAIA